MNSILVFDSEDSCKKNSPEEKSANDISVACTDLKTKDSDPISAPSSISESGNKFYFSGENALDKTTDEAIDKYDSTYEQNVKKVKDVSVQTTNHMDMPGTINKQCQCDLGLSENSNFTLVVNPSVKKIKFNICGYEYEYGYISHRNVTWKAEPFEQEQDEGKILNVIIQLQNRAIVKKTLKIIEKGNEPKYFENKATASQIKMSGIRVGLSKRVRPPPLHLMN